MPDPIVVQIIDEYRRNLLDRESRQFENMTQQWLKVERALDGQVSALAFELDRMRSKGETVNEWRIQRLDRYKSLLAQAQGEVGRYAQYANDVITEGQLQSGAAGAELAQMVLKSMGVRGAFDLLPIEAIEAMAGLTGDGSPLLDLLKESWPDAAQGMTDKLMRAIAMGQNPRVTARQMMDGLANGLNRMLTIARTEQLRSYRSASLEQYRRSGLVTKYKRIAARQTRTCLACLMLDGKEYELEESFSDHPNGRCALVPIVKGMPVIKWTEGPEWFAGLSETEQRGIMGPAKYNAWKAGKVELGDLITTHTNETWGDSPAIKSNRGLGI